MPRSTSFSASLVALLCVSGAFAMILRADTLHVAAVGVSQEFSPKVLVIDGDSFRGTLKQLSGEAITFLTGENQERELPLEDFLMWGAPKDAPSFSRYSAFDSARLILADGSCVTADIIELNADTLNAESRLLGRLQIPLSHIAAILIAPPVDPMRVEEFVPRLTEEPLAADQLTLANGDTVQGTLAGIEVAETDGSIILETDAGRIPFDVGNVKAIVFDPRTLNSRKTPAKFRIGLSDGSSIFADSATIDGGTARITRFVGANPADIPWQVAADKIAFIAYSNRRVAWLEDREPDNYQYLPFLSGAWDWEPGKNVLGQSLRSGEVTWPHGLGVHSASQLTYVLREPAERFEAEIALDDAAKALGSVVFRVSTFHRRDGETVRDDVYTSPMVRAGDAPLPVSVDLKDAVGIRLVVEFGESGDQQDYANWLNARLIRPQD